MMIMMMIEKQSTHSKFRSNSIKNVVHLSAVTAAVF